jgi:hypothetical protein
MSDFDAAGFKEKISRLTDDELIALVSINAGSIVKEALGIAQAEIAARGLSADVQEVIFDHYLNSFGYAGRLILLDEQIMFLSTGLAASGGSSTGSVVGVIASEARGANRRYTANTMDFSALENDGSWIYYLDQVKNCETESSFLGGKKLILEVVEDGGKEVRGIIMCNDLSKEDFEKLPTQILQARNRLASKGDA